MYSVPQPLVAQGRAGCQPVHMFIPNGTELSAWSREVRLLLILRLCCHLLWLLIRLLSTRTAVAVAATSTAAASTTSIATAATTSGTASAAATSGTAAAAAAAAATSGTGTAGATIATRIVRAVGCQDRAQKERTCRLRSRAGDTGTLAALRCLHYTHRTPNTTQHAHRHKLILYSTHAA